MTYKEWRLPVRKYCLDDDHLYSNVIQKPFSTAHCGKMYPNRLNWGSISVNSVSIGPVSSLFCLSGQIKDMNVMQPLVHSFTEPNAVKSEAVSPKCVAF